MGFSRNILPIGGKNPLKTEPIDCAVTGNNTNKITVSYPAGYYQFKVSFGYTQYDRSNESFYYRDSNGVDHSMFWMAAGDTGESPSFSLADFVIDLTLWETPEAIKKKTSFTLICKPNNRNPHFYSFKAVGLRRVGGGGA
ncbi:hypothetical protein [Holdemania massiliensis]|uniref:hypothetical protein n=1 Tax=Holdemania massiliensis TaxID=1468449 RepID=UPI001F06D187|nr:hypothetical protein [Holdemania massiliensis]MCH1940041.1 hypothetical protein [Holdemania massiliensis]